MQFVALMTSLCKRWARESIMLLSCILIIFASLSTFIQAARVHNNTYALFFFWSTAYFVMPYFVPAPSSPYPTLASFLFDLTLALVVGDFFLYWGHRVQHESQYLYDNHHSFHHSLVTPTPAGTLYIDSIDATLQVRAGECPYLYELHPSPPFFLSFFYTLILHLRALCTSTCQHHLNFCWYV